MWQSVAATQRPVSAEEAAWLALIETVSPKFIEKLPVLDAPFPNVTPPQTIRVLTGNQGGNDGFTYEIDTICTDLSALQRNYGDASTKGNDLRMMRVLSHEYTHLLTKQQLIENPWSKSTVYGSVLWELYYEGLGNLYSLTLSEKWVGANGVLTAHARATLESLEPVMLERLSTLAQNPDRQEARRLRADLSAGPFTKKWGALPIALWLAADTKFEPAKIEQWVAKGPGGILELAVKYAKPERRPAFARLLVEAEALHRN